MFIFNFKFYRINQIFEINFDESIQANLNDISTVFGIQFQSNVQVNKRMEFAFTKMKTDLVRREHLIQALGLNRRYVLRTAHRVDGFVHFVLFIFFFWILLCHDDIYLF